MRFYFDNAADFWWMSGHGPYVWACYGVTLIVLIALAMGPTLRRAKFIQQQRALLARQNVAPDAAQEVKADESR